MQDWKSVVAGRVGPLPVEPAREADIIDELAQHAADHARELMASGVPEGRAVAIALKPLAARARVAAEIARADRPRPLALAPVPTTPGRWWTGTLREIQYAIRVLRRSPGFAAIVIATLAVGIGANTAMFSVINSVLLRPLPYADSDRLVIVGERAPDGEAGNVGYETYLDWRDRSHSFQEMALIRPWMPTLMAGDGPEQVPAMRVTSNYFKALGVTPAIGRGFRPDDDTAAGWHVLLVSDALWRRRFGADPHVSGHVVTMNDQPYTIIGVMPRSYEPLLSEHFYQPADLWAPLGYDVTQPQACRGCQHLKTVARIKSGASLEAATSDIDAVQQRLRAEHPQEYVPSTMTLVPLSDELTGRVRPALLVLMAAVGCVLLITCVNVANLFLARVAGRAREFGLRAALGASRARLIRQSLIECLVTGVSGAALGLVGCAWGVPLLARLTPTPVARLAESSVDRSVLLVCLGLALLTSLLFGLLPALRASRVDVQSLQGDGRRTSRAATSLARRVLIAAEVALAVILVTGAGLMIESVVRLLNVDPGFSPAHVLTVQVAFNGKKYGNTDKLLSDESDILAKLQALPGVQAAAAAGQIPLGGNGDRWGFHVEGRQSASAAQDPFVERYSVTPEYFAVMNIPLVRGRLINDGDRTDSDPVMLIGVETARQLWPGGDPVGAHVRIGDPASPARRIVGIVGDVRHVDLASTPTMQMYLPESQVTDGFLTFVIRTSGDPEAAAGDARRVIRSVSDTVPIYGVHAMNDLVTRSVGPRQFVMTLLTAFGAIALLMTAVGVYGVISFSVAERTREIGIRSALGASRTGIVRLILGGGLSVVGLGLAAGAAGSLATTQYLKDSLFAVSAHDPLTLTGAVVTLLLVAILAHTVPVLRALRVEPTVALRQ